MNSQELLALKTIAATVWPIFGFFLALLAQRLFWSKVHQLSLRPHESPRFARVVGWLETTRQYVADEEPAEVPARR
jgi:hypothetical protein